MIIYNERIKKTSINKVVVIGVERIYCWKYWDPIG